MADATKLGGPAFAARYAELLSFAAKISQTVEDDRENIQPLLLNLSTPHELF